MNPHDRTATLRAAVAILLGLLALPAGVGAQGIVGVVRDSASAAPLPGVLVSVLGLDGERIRGVLTDDAGRFAVELPLGRYQLRAERIGLRPVTTERFDLDTFNLRREVIEMTDRAVEIAGLVVDARLQSCRIDPEGAVRLQRWWQEIKTALGVSAVLQRESFADFQVEKFEREWDRRLRRIVASNSRVQVTRSSQPFVSEGAEFLSEGGYVQGQVTGQLQYYAPDADVLLSNLFLSEHCFRLVEDDDREDQLGLRFEPAAGRRVTEIMGTLWVDTTTAELQALDFRYGEVDDVPRNESGGLVAFDYLDSGAWIVSEWYIRMPRLGVPGRIEDGDFEVIGYVDTGGRVTPLATDRESDRAGIEGAIRGTVYDSIRGVGLPDARVRILGTRFEAVTDPSGRFVITNVPVGRHNVTFSHDDLVAWGLGSSFVEVEVEQNRTTSVDLAIPSFRQAALALCLGEGVRAETVLVGIAVGRDRSPLPLVPLELTWYPKPGDTEPWILRIRTESDGRFVVCTIPADARVAVRAEVGGVWRDVFDVAPPAGEITYREVWFTGR